MFNRKFRLYYIPHTLPELGIKIKDEIRENLYERSMSKVTSERELHRILNKASLNYGLSRKIDYSTIYNYIKGIWDIPIWIIDTLCNLTSFPYDEIENSIERYGMHKSKIYGKFPISHSQEFEYICGIINSAGHSSSGGPIIKWRNARKVCEIGTKIFGRFNYKEKLVGPSRSTKQLHLPSIINTLLESLHPFPLFPSLDEPLENRLAYLSGVITNKGSELGNIIYKKDRNFLEKLKDLLESVGCESKIFDKVSKSQLAFTRNFASELFNLMEKSLPKEILPPQIEMMRKIIKISRAELKPKNEVEEEALRVLEKEPMSIPHLSLEVGIELTRAYRLISRLEKEGKVKRVGNEKKLRKPSVIFGVP